MLEDENMIFLATDLRPPRKISNSFIYFSNPAEKAKTEKILLTLSSGTPAKLSNRQLLAAKLRRTRARALGKTD